MITAQEYFQKWEKKHNPFYPNEQRWNRVNINRFLADYDKMIAKKNPSRLEKVVEDSEFEAVKCLDCGKVFKNKK